MGGLVLRAVCGDLFGSAGMVANAPMDSFPSPSQQLCEHPPDTPASAHTHTRPALTSVDLPGSLLTSARAWAPPTEALIYISAVDTACSSPPVPLLGQQAESQLSKAMGRR